MKTNIYTRYDNHIVGQETEEIINCEVGDYLDFQDQLVIVTEIRIKDNLALYLKTIHPTKIELKLHKPRWSNE